MQLLFSCFVLFVFRHKDVISLKSLCGWRLYIQNWGNFIPRVYSVIALSAALQDGWRRRPLGPGGTTAEIKPNLQISILIRSV